MMTKLLYEDFLTNKRVYNLAQASWKRLLRSLLKKHGYTYTSYINQMQNGKKEYDGNPIFNAFIPEIKCAIRIIQVSPKEEGDNISAWIDEIELNEKSKNHKVKELVIDIKLSKESKIIAKNLMNKWITGQLNDSKLDAILAHKVS